jgi:hypothetical protein
MSIFEINKPILMQNIITNEIIANPEISDKAVHDAIVTYIKRHYKKQNVNSLVNLDREYSFKRGALLKIAQKFDSSIDNDRIKRFFEIFSLINKAISLK